MSASDSDLGPGTAVWDAAGVCGTIVGGDGEAVAIELADGRRIATPREDLVVDDHGHCRLDLAFDGVLSATEEPLAVLPLCAETLRVGAVRRETGRVCVDKRTLTREEVIEVPLWDESVEVERVPIGVVVDAPQPTRQEGDTIIIPIHEEVVVVETRLIVREEVRLHLHRARRREVRREILRSEVATTRRVPVDDAADEADEPSLAAPLKSCTTTKGETS